MRVLLKFPHPFGILPLIALAAGWSTPAHAQFSGFTPGNLVVSRSVYSGTASTVTVGEKLPPNCPVTATCPTKTATDTGAFPAIGVINQGTGNLQNVFNNDVVDASFGVTSPIFLDQMTTGGTLINTLAIDPTQIVTSFSSKSELALNLSTDGTVITFMGYTLGSSNSLSLVNNLDVSNSNTPGVNDPTNPVASSFYRGVAQVNAQGALTVTDTNAYSGNNGRAAILASGLYYTVGNDNNGGGTPSNITTSTGAEIVTPNTTPGTPVMIDPTFVSHSGDKAGKDSNFRGLTISPNGTIFVTKGSGSNGINTIYQVGLSGTLPIVATATSTTITIPTGFPTAPAKTAGINNIYPFGIWFANSNTLYVGDEGDGSTADAGNSIYAGLQKWILVNGTWQLAYVMQNGLNLGQQYSVPNYPASLNPATAGLRNITGRVNSDGTVTVWALTSTVSSNGDQGADPNKLVMITDVLANTNPAAAANEQFTTIETAAYATVLRGVAFTPGTTAPALPATLGVTTGAVVYNRVTKLYSCTITVTNNGRATVDGPLTVLLSGLPEGVTAVGGNSVVIPGTSTLAAGQSGSATVTFNDPSNVRVTFSTSVTGAN